MYTIVLAATRREAVDWAQQNEVPFRSIRFAQDASSLGGRFFDRIVELPSFGKRRDRFSVIAAVKRLKRVLPDIPHEVLESFTPSPPKPSAAKFTREQWLFGDAEAPSPFSNALPVADDYVEPESEVQDSPLVDPTEESVADRKDMDLDLNATPEPLSPAQAEAAQEVVTEVTESLEKIDDGLTAAGPDPAKPKRKGRRTNEQKAYDEALAAYESLGDESAHTELEVAREALAKRHPDDERLAITKVQDTPKPEATPGVASGAPDLDF